MLQEHTILMFTPSYFPQMAKTQKLKCNHEAITELLVQQWKKLTRQDITQTRFVKHNLALLIEREYGIDHILTESYLSNMERGLLKAA